MQLMVIALLCFVIVESSLRTRFKRTKTKCDYFENSNPCSNGDPVFIFPIDNESSYEATKGDQFGKGNLGVVYSITKVKKGSETLDHEQYLVKIRKGRALIRDEKKMNRQLKLIKDFKDGLNVKNTFMKVYAMRISQKLPGYGLLQENIRESVSLKDFEFDKTNFLQLMGHLIQSVIDFHKFGFTHGDLHNENNSCCT